MTCKVIAFKIGLDDGCDFSTTTFDFRVDTELLGRYDKETVQEVLQRARGVACKNGRKSIRSIYIDFCEYDLAEEIGAIKLNSSTDGDYTIVDPNFNWLSFYLNKEDFNNYQDNIKK